MTTTRNSESEDRKARELRPIRLLESISQARYPPRLSQLAQRTGIPKTTARRLLLALERLGYIAVVPGQDGYVPGPCAFELGLSIMQTSNVMRACRGVLGALAELTGETCNLNALAGDQVKYLLRVEPDRGLRLQLHLTAGTLVPLHCTASGKLFLAFMAPFVRRQVLDRLDLKPYGPKTILTRERLVEDLNHTRARVVGVDQEEFVRGMVAIAVPVLNARKDMIAALACHAPAVESSLDDLLKLTPAMNDAAANIARILGRQELEEQPFNR